MKRVLTVAAAAFIALGAAPASASPAAAAAAVHHARCNATLYPPDTVVCPMSFWVGRHPGDVHVVIRTSKEQRVAAEWWLVCGEKAYAGPVDGMTTVRRHVFGQSRAAEGCRMAEQLNGTTDGSVTVVISWVNR